MPTATQKALLLPELLEQILLQLPPTHDIHTAFRAPQINYYALRRVCKTWNAVISSSQALQRRMKTAVSPQQAGRKEVLHEGKRKISIADLIVQFGRNVDRGWAMARKTGSKAGSWMGIPIIEAGSPPLHIFWLIPHEEWRFRRDTSVPVSANEPTTGQLLLHPTQRWSQVEIVAGEGAVLGELFEVVEGLRREQGRVGGAMSVKVELGG